MLGVDPRTWRYPVRRLLLNEVWVCNHREVTPSAQFNLGQNVATEAIASPNRS